MELSLTVFPKPAALVKPAKRTFHDPAFWQDSKLMQLAAFNDLHIGPDSFPDRFGKRFAGISTVAKDIHNTGQSGAVVFQHRNRSGFV